MTISRLRAGLVATFAVVFLMAGAQSAQAQAPLACSEPVLGDLPARGQEKDLVRFELTGLTPGSEYLLKVNGRERKSGVADTDKVTRRFRMPGFGDSNRRVRVEVVVANDACENSPWKLEEKMTYRPAPEPQAPAVQPTPAPKSEPAPTPSPTPPPAPSPPAPPKLDSTPAPQPAIPKAPSPPKTPTLKPALPTPAPTLTDPLRDEKVWISPIDPYQKATNEPLKVAKGLFSRTDQPSDTANSSAALLGLVGVLLLLAGGGAMAWTRFRRYDEERLTEIENPEGKLPTHLDPKAKDVSRGAEIESEQKKRRLPLPITFSSRRAEGEPEKKQRGLPLPIAVPRLRRRGGSAVKQRGAFAGWTEAQIAALSPEEKADHKAKARAANRRKARGIREGAPLPKFDPTAPGAQAAAAQAAAADAATTEPKEEGEPAKKKRLPGLKRGSREIKRGLLAGYTEAEVAAMSAEELEEVKAKGKAERWDARQRRKKAVLPTFDPTAPGGQAPAAPKPDATPEQPPSGPRRIADADRETGSPPVPPVPPVTAPPANGVPQNGPPTPAKPPAPPAAKPAQPPNGQPPAQRSYREQVESELQRILADAGLGAEVDGILADAKKEAQRQGVPIDSDMMLKALCDDTNGSAMLSDSARGELESRFKRIVAEERGEGRSSPGSGPSHG